MLPSAPRSARSCSRSVLIDPEPSLGHGRGAEGRALGDAVLGVENRPQTGIAFGTKLPATPGGAWQGMAEVSDGGFYLRNG